MTMSKNTLCRIMGNLLSSLQVENSENICTTNFNMPLLDVFFGREQTEITATEDLRVLWQWKKKYSCGRSLCTRRKRLYIFRCCLRRASPLRRVLRLHGEPANLGGLEMLALTILIVLFYTDSIVPDCVYMGNFQPS